MTTQELKQQIDKVLGNNIRCLLPSYWWKRLFNQVADRIDEAEQFASELVEASKMPIVESENALKKLDVENGSLASVATMKTMKFSECYVPTDEDSNLTDEELYAKLTPVTGIEMNFPLPDISTANTVIELVAEGGNGLGCLMISEGFCAAMFVDIAVGTRKEWILLSQTMIDELNEYLSQQRWYFLDSPEEVGAENMALFDQIFTIVDCTSDVYVKGMFWERLVKESEIHGGEGGEVIDYFVVGYDAYHNVYQTADDIAHNKEVYAKYVPWGSKPFKLALQFYRKGDNGDIVYNELQNPSYIAFSNFYNGLTYYGVRVESPYFSPDNIDVVFSSDGTVAIYSHTEPRDINIVYASHDGSALDEGYKKANKAIYDRIYNGRYTSIPVSVVMYYELGCSVISTACSKSGEKILLQGMDLEFYALELDSSGNVTVVINTPLSEMFGPSITIDSELSDTSENPVQNKVIKEYVDNSIASAITNTLNTEV